jgi:ppGpp synthetase/RelA/SpoT-type nucleotidyltranferase
MKVIQSIESVYEEQYEYNQKLKTRVDETINRIKKPTWHYFSRIKQLESFALKLETGRFSDPRKLEDFFACTLVVENLDQINKASSLIRQNFTVTGQKPKTPRWTHKESSSFQFDDLRLYANLKQVEYLPNEPLASITFEIQVKTFLQHAWGLATHDLIYKTDEINWPKERIAYQIKAMLEQAEVAISGVNNLINLPEVLKDNPETSLYKKILAFYKEFFNKEELPVDIVRLCKNTSELLTALNIRITDVRAILTAENNAGRGTNYKNLSPFLLILQSIINQRPSLIQDYANSEPSKKFKIIFPKELQIESLLIEKHENIISI